jgi:hypothetical protein
LAVSNQVVARTPRNSPLSFAKWLLACAVALGVSGILSLSAHAGTANAPVQVGTAASPPAPAPSPPAAVPAAPDPLAEKKLKARELFNSGVKAYEQKRYRDAVDLFLQADSLTENPAFSFNIGIAYEDMGDAAMALRHYRDYLRQLPDAPDEDAVEARIERIEELLAAKGVQQVTVLSNPPNARITVDNITVGITPWTGELTPGRHVAVVDLIGYRSETRDFDLPRKRSIDVPVTMLPPVLPIGPEPTAVGTGAQRTAPSAFSRIRPATWAVLGGGVVSLSVALGFEISETAYVGKVDRATDPEQVTMLRQRVLEQRAWKRGFLMLGAGLTITSLVFGYVDQLGPFQDVSAGCDSTQCGLSYSGRF